MAKDLKERLGVKEIIDETNGRKPKKNEAVYYFIGGLEGNKIAYKMIGGKIAKQPIVRATPYYFDI